ncbi:MAG: hypothetical protein HYT77_00995 [Deltaproteobacteria bacterium]|nr:hypothetical protein [Deltaproteobacteria bacterium]
MKPLFVRIDEDLERRLTDLCRREGYKKGALVTRLVREFIEKSGISSNPIKAAEDFGIDISLLQERLKKTPTERLRDHAQFHQFVSSIRGAALKQHD